MSADTQPTLPLPPSEPAPSTRRRRRVWPWIVAIVIVIGLLIAGLFAAEAIARNVVESSIRTSISTELGVPADQQVDVEVEGVILPQLIAGSLDDLTVSSEDVSFDAFEGDVTVHATDVPIRGDAEIGAASAQVVVDQAQLQTLLSTVDGFPADNLGLDAPNIALTTELSFFGLTFDIGITALPSAEDGDLVLAPVSLDLAGAEITADGLRDQFGSLADAVTRSWDICIAEYLPAGLTLSQVAVEGDVLVADFDIDGAIAVDPALQENGSCG